MTDKPTDNANVSQPHDANEVDGGIGSGERHPHLSAHCTDSPQVRAEVPKSEETAPEVRKEFVFPGVLASVPEYREQVMAFLAPHCGDYGDEIDILVAVQEALANAAFHGCKDDPAKSIFCEVHCTQIDITVTVRDPGKGFDLGLADPENYKVTKLSHGRGLVLIRSLMTEVSFAQNGAEIVMRKHLTRES